MIDEQNRSTPQHTGLRNSIVLGLAVLILAVLVFYFGPEVRKQEPDYYAPGRTALVNARMRFSESLAHENELIRQEDLANKELNLAISQLAAAENIDPSDRVLIEEMRQSLVEIEKADHLGENSPRQLQKKYQSLLEQMDALITRLENRSQQGR
jgi:hypothetical protein